MSDIRNLTDYVEAISNLVIFCNLPGSKYLVDWFKLNNLSIACYLSQGSCVFGEEINVYSGLF